MKAKWLLALPAAVLSGGILLVACGGGGGGGHESHAERHGNENWEHEASLADMPSFLEDFSERTNHLYSIVGKYEDLMKTINCYCGCMEYEDDPHAGLFRCYVASKDENGVVWTDHSGLCGICTEELVEIEKWSKQGKSDDEIRQLIEQNFNPNYNA
ncbi:PCYCGC motif-containing (lipo)protein [Cohnella sp. GCM10027633]|uniref:PCYCGC motif-containing (lipo)protein n=1 Tax=unclassified Cohnella TaxID=2636738 RepID=UPI00362880CF